MSDEPKAPLTTTTSIWPAASIVILAVLILISFLVVNLMATQGVTKNYTGKVPIVVGGLQQDLTPSPALTYCQQSEEVPANIADAFVLPKNTSPRPGANTPDLGAGEFDCFEPMATAPASAGALLKFFNTQLEARGWSFFSKGASNGDPQSLFQKAGSDGFYWDVGVTVNKTTSSGVNWTFTIYQNSETI